MMEQARKRHRERGFSLIGLLIVGVIIVTIIWLLAPMCIVWTNANELAVEQEVRGIDTAQVQYRSRFGRFASTLAQLGPPAPGVFGPPGPAAADLISRSLASGERDGYRFVMTATPGGYVLTAKPKFYNNRGHRSYYTDQAMVERWSMSAEGANAHSPEVK